MKKKGKWIDLGWQLGKREMLGFDLDTLPNANFALLGLSGSGKSKLVQSVVGQAAGQGFAVAVVDPGGLLVNDILAVRARQAAVRGPEIFDKVHWFQPGSYDMLPRMDPMAFVPAKTIPRDYLGNARRLALHVAAQQMGEVVQMKQGGTDFEGMARLQRVLTTMLTASGVPLDADGLHLPLGMMYALLLPAGDPAGDELFSLVAPRLDRAMRADIERIRSYRREEDRLREIESFINRTRAVLSPSARAMLSDTSGPAADFRAIIRSGGTQLWDLRPAQYFSHDDKRTWGQYAIHANLTAMLSMPREMRVPFLLVIDEASELLNEMLIWALGAMRKTGTPCSIWLLSQDLSGFKKKDGFDARPKILSQCNVISFQQQWPEDTELLARVIYGSEVSFEPLVNEVERHGGYEWHDVTEYSHGKSENTNWMRSKATGESRTIGTQKGKAFQSTKNWTKTSSDATGGSEGETDGNSITTSSSQGTRNSPVMVGTHVVRELKLGASNTGSAEAVNNSRNRTSTHTHTQSSSEGGGESVTDNESVNESLALSGTHTDGDGGGTAESVTVSHKKVPLARVVREQVPTGQLAAGPTSEQLEAFRQRLAGQAKRHAVAKLHGFAAVEFVTADIKEPFASEQVREQALAWARREIFARQPYYLVPDFSPEEEERLLREFLEAARAATGQEPAAVPEPAHEGGPMG